MATSGKEAARQIIENLPDDATLEDIRYAMYARKKTERGLHDAEAGNLIDQEDVKREINEWLRSAPGECRPQLLFRASATMRAQGTHQIGGISLPLKVAKVDGATHTSERHCAH